MMPPSLKTIILFCTSYMVKLFKLLSTEAYSIVILYKSYNAFSTFMKDFILKMCQLL